MGESRLLSAKQARESMSHGNSPLERRSLLMGREESGDCWSSFFSPSSLCPAPSRNHWDPHECSWIACVSHQTTKAGPAPTSRQQERDKVHSRSFQHKPQDHQKTSQERYQPLHLRGHQARSPGSHPRTAKALCLAFCI